MIMPGTASHRPMPRSADRPQWWGTHFEASRTAFTPALDTDFWMP